MIFKGLEKHHSEKFRTEASVPEVGRTVCRAGPRFANRFGGEV